MAVHKHVYGLHLTAEEITGLFLLLLQIPYSSASPGNYVVSTFVCVCLLEKMLHFV